MSKIDRKFQTFKRRRDDNVRQSVGGKRFNKRRATGQSLVLESLESRVVLNAASTHVHPATAIIGRISGVVTNDVTGAGVSNDKVALYNSAGSTVAIAYTSASGHYQFGITQNGTYVVRQFTPKGYVQTSPTFTNVPPATGYPFQSPINITTKAINLETVLKVGYTPFLATHQRPGQLRWSSSREHARLVLSGRAHNRHVRWTAELVCIPKADHA
jgi:hypothetical protein